MDNQPTILHVDSERSLRILISHELAKCGYTVLSAQNDREARKLLSGDEPIHVAILSSYTDLPLDPEFIDFIKQARPEIGIVIIAGGKNWAAAAQGREVSAILQKPYLLPELIEKLETAIQRSADPCSNQ